MGSEVSLRAHSPSDDRGDMLILADLVERGHGTVGEAALGCTADLAMGEPSGVSKGGDVRRHGMVICRDLADKVRLSATNRQRRPLSVRMGPCMS